MSSVNKKVNKNETPEALMEMIFNGPDLFLSMETEDVPEQRSAKKPPFQVFQRRLQLVESKLKKKAGTTN